MYHEYVHVHVHVRVHIHVNVHLAGWKESKLMEASYMCWVIV